MREGLTQFLGDPPRSVNWQEIEDFARVDVRLAALRALVGDRVGIQVDALSWAPAESPPGETETLAWAFIVRPDLAQEILGVASEELRAALTGYLERLKAR